MVKIFIGNVAPGTTDEDLRNVFEEYGTVSECSVISNFAFVHMEDQKEAEKAIQNANNRQLNGSALSVEMSHGKKRPRDSGGPMRRGRGGMMPYNGPPRGRGPPMGRGMPPGPRSMRPGFRPRPWELDPYHAPPIPVPSYRSMPPLRNPRMRGGPGMGGRPMRPGLPPRGAPRAMRGRGGPRQMPPPPVPPPTSYMDDGNGMMYSNDPNLIYDDGTDYYAGASDPSMMTEMSAGAGDYDYYSGTGQVEANDPSLQGSTGVVYDNYGTGDYTGAEGYDQNAYYGDYSYDYSQEPNYTSTNGARYNPYSRQ